MLMKAGVVHKKGRAGLKIAEDIKTNKCREFEGFKSFLKCVTVDKSH